VSNDESTIPGLTKQQCAMLELVIERAVNKGVCAALKTYNEGSCDRRCDRAEMIENRQGHDRLCLYGEPDSLSGGLVGHLRDVESTLRTLRRIAWIAVGTAGSGMVSAIIALIIAFATRGG
jgi:hypothetical protein